MLQRSAAVPARLFRSPAAEPAGAILRKQLTGKLPPGQAAENERVLVAMEEGRTVEQVSQALHVLYRPSVQPYLISWMKHVPAKVVAAMRMPVLIVQGGTDIQVGMDQAQALKAAKPDATLAIIPDMNHVLKQVPIDPAVQARSYGDPTLPLHPALIGHIKAFLDKRK
ncbi:hypothetical protein IP92_01862 [Pseudoduganella flava]|uniref:Serine aminopeptidase S33 domain-containing protein n=1 Tax=Pseudoduganella flava TaxID=871742 RepID=A0A562PVR7_9BURK|nr:hypothetical protein [Pseudoduganella flava]QGZ39576.1 hypothetical protein GO485_11305 [Pseudoduganella flava]TWI48473.1 hypothetical protein IP92_01862 [Pseudoduganella flava]